MTLPLKPAQGGFSRPFGCGLFIKGFLLGTGPYDSPSINPEAGACQTDSFYYYKQALRLVIAEDRAIRQEEKDARKARRFFNPDNIEALTRKHLRKLPYKSWGCSYHSFVVYFGMLQKLGWVEPSGVVEDSAFQDNYPNGQPRIYFRLTEKGKSTLDSLWANPHKALYG